MDSTERDPFDALDALLGLDHTDPMTALMVHNSQQTIGLIYTLRTWRIEQGIDDEQLATQLGVSVPDLAQWERLGADLRLSQLRRYANAVGLRLALTAERADE